MNPYKFFRLIILSRNFRHYSSGSGGFALPMAIMVGLVLTVIGIVIMQRSMFQQNDATSKAATSQAQNAAEAGVARITNLLNEPQRRFLATLPACRDLPLRRPGQACTDPAGTTAGSVTPNWQNLSETQIRNWSGSDVTCQLIDDALLTDIRALSNNSDWQDLPQGKFRLVGYKFTDSSGAVLPPGKVPIPDGGVGVLTVEGAVNVGQPNAGVSRIEVKIPVTPGPPDNFAVPGLWVNDIGSLDDSNNNNKVNGDVLVNDCSADLARIDAILGSGYSAKYTSAEMPEVPPLPDTCYELGVTTGGQTGVINSDLTLPRPGDTSVPITLRDGTVLPGYVYCAGSINYSGNNTLTVNTRAFSGSSASRQMVILHVRRNIELTGSSKLLHQCPMPGDPVSVACTTGNYRGTDFNIYGRAPLSSNPKVCLRGGGVADAFLLAPNYQYGANGNSGINGTVMVRTISNATGCGANSNNVIVEQTGTWDDIIAGIEPKATAPTLGAFTGWSSQPTDKFTP